MPSIDIKGETFMKSKAAKIVFLISWLPWAAVLLYGVYGVFFGVDFFGTRYGWEGFLVGIMCAGILLCIVPVLPVCLIYEICYIVCNCVPGLRRIPVKRFFLIAGVLCVVVVGGVLCYEFRLEMEAAYQKVSAKHMIKNAEELIPYGDYTAKEDGIFGLEEFICHTIMIDYDKPAVGLLFDASFDEFHKVKLYKMDTEDEIREVQQMERNYYVQTIVPLSAPGKRLLSFYYDEYKNGHRTIAFLMEMENGDIYYADRIGEEERDGACYLGLYNAKYFIDGGKYLSELDGE